MFPDSCDALGLAGWTVMLLVWTVLVGLAVWGITWLFPDPPPPTVDRAAPPSPRAG